MKSFALAIFGLFMLAAPSLVAAQGGGIVTCGIAGTYDCGTCELIAMGNNVINFIIRFMLVFIAIIFAYAGYRLVMSRGSTSEYEAAKRMLSNIIIGLIILLIAWLAVDTIMKLLLRNDGQVQYDSTGALFGPWNNIQCTRNVPLFDGEATRLGTTQYPDAIAPIVTGVSNVTLGCTPLPNGAYNCAAQIADCQARGGIQLNTGAISTVIGQVVVTPGISRIGCDPLPNGAYNCTAQIAECRAGGGIYVENLANRSTIDCQTLAGYTGVTGGGVQCNPANTSCSVAALMAAGLTAQQANIMSCIAMTESSGNPNTPPYNVTNPGSNSTACGTFQITQTTWNNYPPSGLCADWRSNCQNAACNAQTMVNLVNSNGYSDWTCPNCNNNAAGCIAQYGG
jgi:hypothetical protein